MCGIDCSQQTESTLGSTLGDTDNDGDDVGGDDDDLDY